MTARVFVTLLLVVGSLIATLGTLSAAPADAPDAAPAAQPELTATAAAQTAVTATQTAAAAPTQTQTAAPVATATTAATATATPTVTLVPATLPDLTIGKTESSEFVVTGDLLIYTITVMNSIGAGPTSAATTLTDEIPANTDLVSVSGPACTTFGDFVSCSVPALSAAQTQTYTIVVQVTGVSGETILNIAHVDPSNSVAELNETNNTAFASTLIVGPGPTATTVPATAVPPEAPTPVPPPPPAPPAPPAATTLWARVITPTQTYSSTDDPLWIAQPGELYWVMEQQEGWILGVWEGDTRAWAVWMRSDAVELVNLERPAPPEAGQLWFVVFSPTQTYSASMEPLWVAMPGEWYQVLQREGGWALGRWEGDPPEFAVWVQEGPNLEFATFDLPH
jgi:uncharacterized repeat protein (TIGR01451 family)